MIITFIGLNLDYIKDNEWKVIMVSALMGRGIKPVIGTFKFSMN